MNDMKVGDRITYDDSAEWGASGMKDHFIGEVTAVHSDKFFHCKIVSCFPDANCQRTTGTDFYGKTVYAWLVSDVDDLPCGMDWGMDLDEEWPAEETRPGLVTESIDPKAWKEFKDLL
jgi:hypothetical protein